MPPLDGHHHEGESGVSIEEIMGERLKIDRSARELIQLMCYDDARKAAQIRLFKLASCYQSP